MKKEQNHHRKMIPVSPAFRIAFQILMVVVLPVPLGIASYAFGLLIMHPIYLFWHEFLGFDWIAGGSSTVDVRRFLEFWYTGFGIYIVYVVFDSLIEAKSRYVLLCSLILTFVPLAVSTDMRQPRGMILADFGYSLVYAFLFAMIMFAVFTLSATVLDKRTKLAEWRKILISFVLSLPIGYGVSWVVWIILFRIFHG